MLKHSDTKNSVILSPIRVMKVTVTFRCLYNWRTLVFERAENQTGLIVDLKAWKRDHRA